MAFRENPIIIRGPERAAIRAFRSETRETMLKRQQVFLGVGLPAQEKRLLRELRIARRSAGTGESYDIERHYALARLCNRITLQTAHTRHTSGQENRTRRDAMSETTSRPKVVKSDAEWQKELTPEQYYITRKHGTEPAWTGPYLQEKSKGVYNCVGCGAPLFSSATKYESGSGWPSFYQPIEKGAVSEHADGSFLMRRTEIRCATCDAHLGHVFPDGPQPTGQRYCMNGHALKLKKADDAGTK
jgi:peptide-methionine (R)-S-oxide reductase